jgi:hypothetical protein
MLVIGAAGAVGDIAVLLGIAPIIFSIMGIIFSIIGIILFIMGIILSSPIPLGFIAPGGLMLGIGGAGAAGADMFDIGGAAAAGGVAVGRGTFWASTISSCAAFVRAWESCCASAGSLFAASGVAFSVAVKMLAARIAGKAIPKER